MLLILPILLLASSPPISREFTKSDSTRLIGMEIASYPRLLEIGFDLASFSLLSSERRATLLSIKRK